MNKVRKRGFKAPYRSLAYYIGKHIRVHIKGNPLLNHPAVYDGILSAIFEDPSAVLLEEAEILVLDYIPLKSYYQVSRKDYIGAIFIKMEEIRFFEILEKEAPAKLKALLKKGYESAVKEIKL